MRVDKIWLYRLIIVVIVLGCTIHATQAQENKAKLPMISTHRGASSVTPENTLIAFSKAIELGADFIELDVRTSADGVQVIMHDGSLKRTTGLDATVEKTTLAEIKKLSAGFWFGEKYKDQKVPTLEEVCELVAEENKNRKHPAKLYVDSKEINAHEVLLILNKYGLLDSAVFYGSVNTLVEIKKIHAHARVMPSYPGKEKMDDLIHKIAPYAVDVDYDQLSTETISFCHANGIKVFSDLLGKHDVPSAYRLAIQLQIDLIQTDNISGVLQVYKEVTESKRK
jgi:glycerophosphoryl diester phosphodiesterase